MITDILISAGGKGTRMKHLSKDMPKHLLDVEGRPFLHYVLENVMQAGFQRIYLVIGYRKEHMEKFAASHRYPVTLIDQFGEMPDKYGTACPVMCARKYLQGKQFASIAGDNYYSVKDLQAMRNHNDAYTYVGGLMVEHPEEKGVLVVRDGDVLEKIVEKPKEFVGNLINVSLYKFTPTVFEVIDSVGVSSRGEYEITDAISTLAKRGDVRIQKLEDSWIDFGRPEDIKRMEKFLRSAKLPLA
ncbi:MAG: sugar phosphate nucleotidyltransferase [Parcubacteria group bacterium]